jgi:serine/threonine protein kinase
MNAYMQKHLSGHLQKTVPKDSKALFDGYMLNIENFPIVHNVRTNIEWSEFKDVVLLKSSAAYDIFLGTWEKQRVIIKRVMNSSVASKVQPRKGSHTEMEMEINLLSRMNHPNIIRILGSGTKPLRFSVLEYLSGGTLSALLNYTYHDHQYYGTPIPKAKAFEYGIKIASALAYMHEDWHKAARIFHRDLKTDNIAFTASGEIKLFDFGLAKGLRKTIFDDEDAVFPFGQGAGSWRYMAPEVALGEPYNHKSDVYSYSMILYHLLRGKHPVPNDMNRTEHYNEFYLNYWRPDFSLSLFRNWPLQLTRLLSRAWNYDIRVRPNFKEIVADLNIIEKKFVDVGSTKLHHSGPRFVEYKEPSSKQ